MIQIAVKDIGVNIVKIRKQKNITQKKLAKMCGMAPQTLLKIEKGITIPKLFTLIKIITCLEAEPNILFGVPGDHVMVPKQEFEAIINGIEDIARKTQTFVKLE